MLFNYLTQAEIQHHDEIDVEYELGDLGRDTSNETMVTESNEVLDEELGEIRSTVHGTLDYEFDDTYAGLHFPTQFIHRMYKITHTIKFTTLEVGYYIYEPIVLLCLFLAAVLECLYSLFSDFITNASYNNRLLLLNEIIPYVILFFDLLVSNLNEIRDTTSASYAIACIYHFGATSLPWVIVMLCIWIYQCKQAMRILVKVRNSVLVYQRTTLLNMKNAEYNATVNALKINPVFHSDIRQCIMPFVEKITYVPVKKYEPNDAHNFIVVTFVELFFLGILFGLTIGILILTNNVVEL